MTMRLAFVPGATPDKWARNWRDRFRESLELIPVEQDEQRLEGGLRDDLSDAHCPV